MSVTNIFLDGVLVDVDVSFWSASKVLTPEDLGLQEHEVADSFHLGKKLLIPMEVIRAFRQIESRARREVELNSFPFPIGNARFIPRKKFVKVLGVLKELQGEYNKLVENLIINYDEYRRLMLPVYTEAANTAYINQLSAEKDFGIDYDPEKEKQDFIDQFIARINTLYPQAESLRTKFALDWSAYEIAIPRMKKKNSNDIVKEHIAEEEYRTQIQGKISGFVDDVIKTLRSETIVLCSRIMNNLNDGKVIRGQTLNSLNDFITRFKDLNFIKDQSVESQLDSLQQEITGRYSSDDIKDNTELQEVLKRKLGSIIETASNIHDINSITGEYKRKISWDGIEEE